MKEAPASPAGFDEVGRLEFVLVRGPAQAFVDEEHIAAQWRELNYPGSPNFDRALVEHSRFVEFLAGTGARIEYLPADPAIGLDAIYARDSSVVTPSGMILCSMGKPARAGEPAALVRVFDRLGIPTAGRIEPPGMLEGGDVVWLGPDTVAVGQGYRTNQHGIAQLRDLLGSGIDLRVVPLPHWKGRDDVFHLMSMLSPVDRDLLLVYSPLLPIPFREFLLERGNRLVEVAPGEFATMACNVMTLAPRDCLMLPGNPLTRANLEHAGVRVRTYEGSEISVKGEGGPTCLTRPVRRS